MQHYAVYVITNAHGKCTKGIVDQGSMTDCEIRKRMNFMLFLLHPNFVILGKLLNLLTLFFQLK